MQEIDTPTPSKTPAKATKTVKSKAKPVEPAPQPAAAAQPSRRSENGVSKSKVKPNRRSEETIANILAATEEVILRSGADRISILDVCQLASVSRGTFYRYFSSQEDLLDTFSRHKRENFHLVLTQTVGSIADPEERLNAMIEYLDVYMEESRAQRLLIVAPEYALSFFRRIFHDSIVRFQVTLDVVFDDWDRKLGVRLDRELICEMVIRYVLSEVLVPESAGRRLLPARVKRLLASLVQGSTSRTRR